MPGRSEPWTGLDLQALGPQPHDRPLDSQAHRQVEHDGGGTHVVPALPGDQGVVAQVNGQRHDPQPRGDPAAPRPRLAVLQPDPDRHGAQDAEPGGERQAAQQRGVGHCPRVMLLQELVGLDQADRADDGDDAQSGGVDRTGAELAVDQQGQDDHADDDLGDHG